MKKTFILMCVMALFLSACALGRTPRSTRTPGGAAAALPATTTETPEAVLPASTSTPTSAPVSTPTATQGIGSLVGLVQDTTCRKGPGQSYFKVFSYFGKDTVELEGRNEGADWVLIQDAFNADVVCWVPTAALMPMDWLDGVAVAEYAALPAAPTSISAPKSLCGTATGPVVVKWSPVASGVEYQVYRNGELVSTQSDGRYYDPDMPKPHTTVVYTYVVQAVNDYGVSPHALTVSVAFCGK